MKTAILLAFCIVTLGMILCGLALLTPCRATEAYCLPDSISLWQPDAHPESPVDIAMIFVHFPNTDPANWYLDSRAFDMLHNVENYYYEQSSHQYELHFTIVTNPYDPTGAVDQALGEPNAILARSHTQRRECRALRFDGRIVPIGVDGLAPGSAAQVIAVDVHLESREAHAARDHLVDQRVEPVDE